MLNKYLNDSCYLEVLVVDSPRVKADIPLVLSPMLKAFEAGRSC